MIERPSDRRKIDELKRRLEVKKPTPKQIQTHIDMAGSDPVFTELEPLYTPTEADIEQKQEVIKRKKRDR